MVNGYGCGYVIAKEESCSWLGHSRKGLDAEFMQCTQSGLLGIVVDFSAVSLPRMSMVVGSWRGEALANP